MPDYKVYYISWWDHCSHTTTEWRDIEEAEELEPVLCHTVGYLLHETDDSIVLGQTIHSVEDFNDKYSGDQMIIKKLIKEQKEIKL